MAVKVDGKSYESIEQAPDLGNLTCIDASNYPIRKYQGFTSDKLKLPKYDDLGDGSTAILIDPDGVESTIIARYYSNIKKWLDTKGGIIV